MGKSTPAKALNIKFHNPNAIEETARFLAKVVAQSAVRENAGKKTDKDVPK